MGLPLDCGNDLNRERVLANAPSTHGCLGLLRVQRLLPDRTIFEFAALLDSSGKDVSY